jgi:hypothetical protein
MKRHFPDKPLGDPVKAFDDTFSAETVLLEGFFNQLTPEQQKAALEYDGPENHGDDGQTLRTTK